MLGISFNVLQILNSFVRIQSYFEWIYRLLLALEFSYKLLKSLKFLSYKFKIVFCYVNIF